MILYNDHVCAYFANVGNDLTCNTGDGSGLGLVTRHTYIDTYHT